MFHFAFARRITFIVQAVSSRDPVLGRPGFTLILSHKDIPMSSLTIVAALPYRNLCRCTMSTTDKNLWFQANSDSTITVLFDETKPVRFSTAYWNIRGLGAPLRMMLCAAKVNHVVHMYDFLEEGEHGWKSGYYAEKAAKFIPDYTPFMNLPCLADEDEKVVVTQLNACLHYAGKFCGMMGQSALEETTCIQFLCEIYDLRNTMTDYVYANTGTPESVIKSGRGHFSKFENLLKLNERKCFTVGSSMTAPDFHLFEMIDQYDSFQKSIDPTADILADYPNVRAFFDGFSKLDENQFYLDSIFHSGLPFNAGMASFGSALNGGLYQQRRGPDMDALPLPSWYALGKITLRPKGERATI